MLFYSLQVKPKIKRCIQLSIASLDKKQELSLKKTNGVGLKKDKKKYNTRLSTCTYTDDRKLRMIIVKDQWTAILANFDRKLVMSSNSI